MIVHLNGWPGVGKKTIGTILAARLGARFIHNHLLHDVAIACCGLETDERWDLYDRVRRDAYEALRARPRSEVFVMTNALCDGSPREQEAWSHVLDLAAARQVSLVPVVLETTLAENQRRIVSADRIGRKLTDPRRLAEYLQTDTIQKPNIPGLLVLDVTHLAAADAASAIAEHVMRTEGRRWPSP